MLRAAVVAISLLLPAFTGGVQKQVEAKVKSEPLKLSIELAERKKAEGKIILANRGNSPTSVWRAGSSWADEALFFEVKKEGRTEVIRRNAQTYTRNVPAPAVLAEGSTYEIAFDLEDGSWGQGPALKDLGTPNARLVAVYRVSASAEAKTHGIWTGEIKSDAVDVK